MGERMGNILALTRTNALDRKINSCFDFLIVKRTFFIYTYALSSLLYET